MNHKRSLFLVALMAVLISASGFQDSPQHKILFEKALFTMETKGDLNGAINIFNEIIKKYPKEREYAAKSQLYIGLCYEKLGVAEARKAYERVVREYNDQPEVVAEARVRLAVLAGPGDKKGFVTRRILADASGVGGFLTADGKYILGLNGKTGDVTRFETASGQMSKITNKRPWSEMDMELMGTAFSHDGKQIAYDSYTSDWKPQLIIRSLDGSDRRTIYGEKDCYAMPLDWSPDAASIIAVNIRNDITELIVISTLDSSVRVLKTFPYKMFIDRATFSPDGRYVAFSFVRDGNPPHGEIFLMTSDGLNEIVVAGHPSEDRLLGWTPDGESLLFLSDRSGTCDIWTVRMTGEKQQGEPELLKKDFGYYSEILGSQVLGIAPDGSFHYKVNTPSGGLYAGAIDLETGKVLSSPSPVTTRYMGPPYNLDWSSDGKYLLYLSRRGDIGPGNNLITIRSDATGEERILKPYLRFVNQMSWAPDGLSIFAVGITEKEMGMYQIDAETGVIIRRLINPIGFTPRLCPDGKTLVFVKGGVMAITKLNLETNEETEIINKVTLSYDLSPDGREVVFQTDSTVKTISLSGGEPKELIRGLAKYYYLKWTNDGRYIIARDQVNENSKIWIVPAQGGTPLKLDLSVPDLISFELHPDNSRFMMSISGETKSELWVMENFLPK
jgi:Tol biopolymer transport system component